VILTYCNYNNLKIGRRIRLADRMHEHKCTTGMPTAKQASQNRPAVGSPRARTPKSAKELRKAPSGPLPRRPPHPPPGLASPGGRPHRAGASLPPPTHPHPRASEDPGVVGPDLRDVAQLRVAGPPQGPGRRLGLQALLHELGISSPPP
jgi:hypothetical protein